MMCTAAHMLLMGGSFTQAAQRPRDDPPDILKPPMEPLAMLSRGLGAGLGLGSRPGSG